MEVIKDLPSLPTNGYANAVLVPVCIAILLKVLGLIWTLIRWIFKDWSYVRTEVNKSRIAIVEIKAETAEMKSILKKIETKLGMLDE